MSRRELSRRALQLLALLANIVLWVLLLLGASVIWTRADAQQLQGCTWRDEFGHRWAVTVWTTATGADAAPWAWFTINADPRRVMRAPVAELEGCK